MTGFSKATILGAVLWLAAPFVPSHAPLAFGSIEHTFVFLPLVAAPLVLLLLSRLLDSDGATKPTSFDLAVRIQPFAAAMVLASFFVPKGGLAAALDLGAKVNPCK
jgi:hypothetical protein